MVFFVCSSCGQSLKKNQVEKHYMQQCRNCDSLTCMDCNKEFWGNDYASHTKCISEDQKYGGKDFKPKPSANKGEVKQEMWIDHVKNTIATTQVPARVSSIIQQLMDYPNIPRKKAKFENFVRNSLKLSDRKLIDQVWELFSKSQQTCNLPAKVEKNENNQNSEDAIPDAEPTKKRQADVMLESNVGSVNGVKKRKTASVSDDEINGMTSETNGSTNSTPMKFKWTKAIKSILREKPDKMLLLKKFKKRMVKQYKLFLGESQRFEKGDFLNQLEERLQKCRKVEISDDCVKLIE